MGRVALAASCLQKWDVVDRATDNAGGFEKGKVQCEHKHKRWS